MDLVKVKWWDIIGHTEWHDPKKIDAMEAALCETVAWKYSHDKKLLKLVGTKCTDRDGHYELGDVNIIPAGCVHSIEILEKGKNAAKQRTKRSSRVRS
jgi:hypothetical protein